MFYLKIGNLPNQMINVCVPNGSPTGSHLIRDVQVHNGNITSTTREEMLEDPQCLAVRAL